MKLTKLFSIVIAVFIIMIGSIAGAQISKPGEVIKDQGTNRVNNRIEQGIDAGFNKIEEGVGGFFKKNKENGGAEEEADEESPSGSESGYDESDNDDTEAVPAPKSRSLRAPRNTTSFPAIRFSILRISARMLLVISLHYGPQTVEER